VAHPLVSHCGDYRLECLQASAHVRAHFGMDGRRQDNKAIRACVHAYESYKRGTAILAWITNAAHVW